MALHHRRGGRGHNTFHRGGGYHGHQHGGRSTRWSDKEDRSSRWADRDDRSSLEAAADAAAKVNAMLIAKGALKPSQLSQQQPNKQKATSTTTGNMAVAEVEINDVPIGCRNMLTRGSTQEEISKVSGAGVSTRGRYLSPHERGAGDRPLYLCVQGPTKESVDIAVHRINEIITNYKNKGTRFSPANAPQQRPQLLGPNPVELMPRLGPPPGFITQPPVLPQQQTITILQEKLFIGLEHAPPHFGVKEKIHGPEGSYLQHVEVETGAKVTLRGKGSGFLDMNSPGRDSIEPMHVFLEHPSPIGLGQAKQLAENLIQTVQQDYAQFQQALAAIPAGHTTIITGLSQQTSIPGTLINTIPTMAPPPIPQQLPSPGSVFMSERRIGTTRFMIPTSISSAVYSLPTSMGMTLPSVLTAQPPPLLVQTQNGPPPQMLGPPHMAPDVTQLVTTMPPEVQVVTQSTLIPTGSPWNTSPNMPSSLAGQMLGSGGPPPISTHTPLSSAPIVTTTYTYHTSSREEPKRRFTEEKLEEKVPENLLGYEHGPPHLANLVVQGPPQETQSQVSQHPPYQPQVSEMYSVSQSTPQLVYTTSAPLSSPDDRSSQFTNFTMTQPGGYPGDNADKQLMPPPPIPASLKRASLERQGGSDRKKDRMSPTGFRDEEDKQAGRGKYQYNQYSNAPQLYTQGESDGFTDQRPDNDPGFQYQPPQQITEQFQYQPSQPPGSVMLQPPPSPGPPMVHVSSLPSHYYQQQPMYSVSPSQSPPHPVYTQHDVLTSTGQPFAVPHTITISGPLPPQAQEQMLQPPPETRLQPEELPPQMEQLQQPPPSYTNMPPPISSGQYMTTQSMPLMAPPTQPPVSYAPQQVQPPIPMSAPQQHSYPPPPGMPYYITS
ncbi:uncharacterized protein LOC143072064 isoform X2 [Mytilus galloprovincialis]|uniref:uncharacterized protein LOC143072064 isoform X2 n=1 Tax=Mytilus galloprovincialis TaxID=29158 RepID=UPI003F7C49F2